MDKKKAKKDIDSGLTEEEKRVRAEQRKRAAKKKRKKLIKTLIVVFIILAIVGFALWKFFDLKRREEAANTLVTYTVERRTITERLSATGTLQPVDSYTVTSKVKGDIISCSFEEGDEVQKDDILYVVDSDDMDTTLRQREMSVEKAEKTLSDLLEKREELTATSDLTGTVTKLYCEVGDTVQKGSVIADIVDNEYMLADIPFHASQADTMSYGTEVTLIIDGTGETLPAIVTEISATTGTNAYGAPTKDVTVKVKNPGGISKETKAICQCGDSIISTDIASFYYNVEEQLTAQYGGEIMTLYISEGSRVADGQTIIAFDSDSLEDQIKDAKDNLENAQMNYDDTVESLGDYDIKAPITGTVVEKNYNVGESIDVTGGNATVAIIYDLSALTFEMSIDELDIFSVSKGQQVEITSDAMKEVYYGEITKISKVGTTTSGTTVYPVTVTITDEDALEKLLPGMNIDAEIEVNKVENVIAVPTGAVARGNTVKVIKDKEALAKWQSEHSQNGVNNRGTNAFGNASDKTEGAPYGQNGKADGETGVEGENPFGGKGFGNDRKGEASGNPEDNAPVPKDFGYENADSGKGDDKASDAPEKEGTEKKAFGNGFGQNAKSNPVYGSAPGNTEYITVKVETGISDDDYIEIISGLNEGDIVIIEQSQTSNIFAMMGGGMGGMGAGMSGRMPAGGMPSGGMPSGGMGANRGGMSGGR